MVVCSLNSTEFYNRFPGRQALIAYAGEKHIPVSQTTAKPWSTDENLFHISYEAGILEDPNITPPADMWKLTTAPENAPKDPETITIEFQRGLPVCLTTDKQEHTDAVEIFLALNALGRKHGIGRIDIVENRFIGVKSRGCYESPGATILRIAHVDLEGLTLDRNVRALRDQFTTVEFSRILYNGHFFSPEREFIAASIPASQRTVNGKVKLKLYRGNVIVEGRESSEVNIFLRASGLSDIWHSRGFTTSINLRWTNLVDSNLLTPPVLFKSKLSGLRSMSIRAACLFIFIIWILQVGSGEHPQKSRWGHCERRLCKQSLMTQSNEFTYIAIKCTVNMICFELSGARGRIQGLPSTKMPFPFTFIFNVPGIINPFAASSPKDFLNSSTIRPPSQTEQEPLAHSPWTPIEATSRSHLPKINRLRPQPRPSESTLDCSSRSPNPGSRKRGWHPAFAEPSISTTTLASTSGYLLPPTGPGDYSMGSAWSQSPQIKSSKSYDHDEGEPEGEPCSDWH